MNSHRVAVDEEFFSFGYQIAANPIDEIGDIALFAGFGLSGQVYSMLLEMRRGQKQLGASAKLNLDLHRISHWS